jgi:four helix bundle protein
VKQNLIADRSFKYALEIVQLYSELKRANEYVISKQLLRSGTSIGANVSEATAAQSRKDFIAKMSIASKEARESLYWLRLLQESQLVRTDLTYQLNQTIELINILTAIIKTTTNQPEPVSPNSKFRI